MRADTDRIAEDLDAIIADCRAIKNQLVDLDLIAYEKRTGGEVSESTADSPSAKYYYLDNVGEHDAKRALRNVRRSAGKVREQLHTARVGVFALFAGEGADQSLRGTTISKRTYDEQVEAQKRRLAAPNDYVPDRIEKQPSYPGKGKR